MSSGQDPEQARGFTIAQVARLPFPVILGVTSTRMAGLVAATGSGASSFSARPSSSLAWTCFLPVHGDYVLHVLPGLLIMPVGYGMSFAPMYAAATAGLPPRLAGITSGLMRAQPHRQHLSPLLMRL